MGGRGRSVPTHLDRTHPPPKLHIYRYRYIDIMKLIDCKLQLHYNDIFHNINIIMNLGRYMTFRPQRGHTSPLEKIFLLFLCYKLVIFEYLSNIISKETKNSNDFILRAEKG